MIRPRVLVPLFVCFAAGTANADDTKDQAQAEMQRALNQQVMAAPFNAGDVKKARAYAEESKKQGVVPVVQAPAYWVPGWSCANLTVYRYYNYGDYQNCVYYHHYYGRYWR
jgi:hypothetical protein